VTDFAHVSQDIFFMQIETLSKLSLELCVDISLLGTGQQLTILPKIDAGLQKPR